MAKLFIICAAILCLAGLSNAQFGPPWMTGTWPGAMWGKPMGGPPAFVQPPQPTVQQIMDRIEMADLPPEMQDSVDQILLDASNGFKACDDAYQMNMIYWQYRICNVMQLRKSTMQISALEKKAADMAAAASPAPGTA